MASVPESLPLACAGGTFLVLLGSWTGSHLVVKGVDTLRGVASRVQYSPTPTAMRTAWFGLTATWVGLVLPLCLAASPVVERVFPEEYEMPEWWQAIYGGLVASLLVHNLFRVLDANLLDLEGRLREYITDVPKLLQGPLIWGGPFVHPVDMCLQVVDAVAGPLLWTFFWEPLSLHAWWVWLSSIQSLWVLGRSNYALPSPIDVVSGMMPSRKSKKKTKAKKESAMKEATKGHIHEAAQKKAR